MKLENCRPILCHHCSEALGAAWNERGVFTRARYFCKACGENTAVNVYDYAWIARRWLDIRISLAARFNIALEQFMERSYSEFLANVARLEMLKRTSAAPASGRPPMLVNRREAA